MSRRWISRLSLRTKVTCISLGVIALALSFAATTSILQMRYQIDAQQHRAANTVALGIARASELALTVGDTTEMSRVANSFLRDPDILFIAAYGNGPDPLVVAVRDRQAWNGYLRGVVNGEGFIVGEYQVAAMTDKEDFANDADSNSADAHHAAKGHANVGRVVVGLSTGPARQAQSEQSRLTIEATLAAAAVGGIILFFTLGSWMRRLQNLVDASQSIARGDFSGSISDKHNDEIGRLAHSFEGMRQALLERDRKLRGFTETLQEQVLQRTHDLEHAVEAAEEASRAKSLFLANMSHELRTPLNGVIGMVDLLLGTPTSAQQRRYCDVAKVSARSLLELINDILDFSKIEAGKLELDSSDFDLHEAVEGVAQMLGERAEKKNLELICGIDRTVPRRVNGDLVRFRQIMINLISNAIKFTERGEVVVNVTMLEHDESEFLIKVEVRDTGMGIPRDRLNRLFQSFSQLDTSTTRKFGGTGLGLAISHRIAEMMGGKMGVKSEEGKGSAFWFTARLHKGTTAPATSGAEMIDLRGMRILAVDDNATNREILQAQLSSWSLRADVASGAAQAMAMLRASAAGTDPYKIAILDIHMPDADGEQLAREIKADPRTRDVILISMSSIGDPLKPHEMSELGFSACLTKPVLPSNLFNTIVGTLAADARTDRPVQKAEAPLEGSLPLEGVRILLAEDHEVNRMVASEILRRAGCRISVAVDGREAVDAAAREKFDAILMDCQMPEVDGFEATRLIRRAEAESKESVHVPIIALTANAIKGDRELCLASGMDGYVTKPIEPSELFRTIQSLLPAGRRQSPATSAALAEDSSTATKSTGELPVDLEALCRRCMGNRKLAAKALETFSGTIGTYVADLVQKLNEGDAKSIAAAAHKIKGAAANVSAEQVRRLASDLETMGRDNSISQAEQTLSELHQEVDRVRQFVATGLRDLLHA